MVPCGLGMFDRLEDQLKLQVVWAWLCSRDVIELHRSSSAWRCIAALVSGARFALSRWQRSGDDVTRSAAWWYERWLHCKTVVRAQGWPPSVWRSPFHCSRQGRAYIASESFYCALDLILARAGHSDTTLAILALDSPNEEDPDFCVHCVVILRSGRCGFVGAFQWIFGPDDARFVKIFYNVVVGDTLEEALSSAVVFVAEHRRIFRNHGPVPPMPWWNDGGTLRMNFCDQDCRGSGLTIIPDPFIIEDASEFMVLATLS